MKILYILPYDWGAMPQYTAEIANAVANYAEVTVIGSKGINDKYFARQVNVIKCFDSFEFSTNNLRKLFSFSTVKSFYSFRDFKIIEDIDPDVIHLTTPIIPPLAIYIFHYGFDRKYPIIYTKHGIISNSGLKEKILEEYVLGIFEKLIRTQKIIVHTLKDKDTLLKLRNINERKIEIIPHGVYSFFKTYGNKSQTEKNTILFFGNIREYKGLRYLIDAIPLILKEIPDLKVIIAGEGDISEFSSLLESKRNVFEIYNEFISDNMVSELFQRSELVVMPYSEMSGQSGVLNVALAFGKPVIASDVGGFNEVLINRKTGLLVPPKDSKALANAILELLENDVLRSYIKTNLQAKALELSWDSIATDYIRLYRKFIS